ncbi:LamG-like jellyroll fold domain-containing protein [Roseimaritima ulvae]|uniref:LamG-like jellyroll fold domain-containing protein n=1 Tax=Roseimaritima ulvae TaxID=980254 RepID=UPI0009FC86C2
MGEHDSGKFVADGIWHHVGISRQGTAFTVWVDGKAIPVANASASIDAHRWQLGRTISKGHHGRFVFIGQLDELHVYHRALSDDEVRHVME